MFEINTSSYVCVLETVKSRQEHVQNLMGRQAKPHPALVWAMTLLTGLFAGPGSQA